MADESFAGPVGTLVFGFPANAPVAAGLRVLLERAEEGAVEILDVECITRDGGGDAVLADLSALQTDGSFDISQFDGVTSGILGADDRAEIAGLLEPGQFAIAVVYEDRSLARVGALWRQAGGAELLVGGVDMGELGASVEGTE